MKWKELFDAWKDKNKDVIIRTEELADSAVKPAERVRKNIAVWFKSGDGVSYRIVHAWVFQPNSESEEAYWENGEPVLATPTTTPPETFRDRVIEKLNNMREQGTIVAYRLDSVDEAAKSAIAFIYKTTTDGVSEERVLVAEIEGEIRVRKIV